MYHNFTDEYQSMRTICICGAGTMGSGIAQVSATAGFKTILYDLNEEIIQKAKAKLEKDLQTLVDKQKIGSEKKEAILNQIHFTSTINECVADVVIEAVVEKIEIKTSLFNQLSQINSLETIFASNTSAESYALLNGSNFGTWLYQ